MKLLVVGSTGLLGQAVVAEARTRSHDVITAARSNADQALDIADERQLDRVVEQVRPDAIFNCAGLTDLSACEEDPGLAYRVNARPVAFLASWSKGENKPFVQVSTDHFFTEGKERPHAEDELVSLANEYARTKFAGERFALTAPLALVLRTSMVGIRAWSKPTLAEWAIQSIQEGKTITHFEDAFTSSLDTGSCARAALDLLTRGASGLLNLGSRQVYTKAEFIRALARHLGVEAPMRSGSITQLNPRRAASLGLDVSRSQQLLGYCLPDLENVVASVIDQYRERVQL